MISGLLEIYNPLLDMSQQDSQRLAAEGIISHSSYRQPPIS
ncbi:MAG: hypothetical protein GPOALKHO_001336 [Sodalis sp.]|nr:MAG: hypothetical protein GPOALKHO_001336 [Sodalis sp.]